MPAGSHSAITVQSQSINLTAGYHSIEVDYCQLAGSAELSLKWKGPNDSAYAVSASYAVPATNSGLHSHMFTFHRHAHSPGCKVGAAMCTGPEHVHVYVSAFARRTWLSDQLSLVWATVTYCA